MKMKVVLRTIAVLFNTVLATGVEANQQGAEWINNDSYVNWKQSASYDSSTFLWTGDGNNGVALHWTVDSTHIHISVAAEADGWVGFGLAEAGGMRGADLVLYTAGSNSVMDGHVLDENLPLNDDSQDWELLNSVVDGGLIIFEVKRLLDTGDTQDRPIINDGSVTVPPTRVIAAWGDTPSVSYHYENRVRSAVRFYAREDEAAVFAAKMDMEAEGFFDFRANNYAIQLFETDYADFCISSQEIIDQGVAWGDLHIIGFEPIIDRRAARHVHHFVMTANERDYVGECEEFPSFEMVYGWAPGEGPLALPDDVGSPLGENGFKSFNLQIHYDNPALDTGVLDSSGLRMYWTGNKRQHDAGMIRIGDPLVRLRRQPLGDGLSHHSFRCREECWPFFMGEQLSITVYRENLHMHKSGARMVNSQIRNGEVIRSASVDFWDFDQQGTLTVQQEPFEVLQGDTFETSCYYKATSGEEFGLGSSDEMCIAFLTYYPRVSVPGYTFGLSGSLPFMCGYDFFLPACTAEYETSILGSEEDLGREFGLASSSTATPVSTIVTVIPSTIPSAVLSVVPSAHPSIVPSEIPSSVPSVVRSTFPTILRSQDPSNFPSVLPSVSSSPDENIVLSVPSIVPSAVPSSVPSVVRSTFPTVLRSPDPSNSPSVLPSVSSSPDENIGKASENKSNAVTAGTVRSLSFVSILWFTFSFIA